MIVKVYFVTNQYMGQKDPFSFFWGNSTGMSAASLLSNWFIFIYVKKHTVFTTNLLLAVVVVSYPSELTQSRFKCQFQHPFISATIPVESLGWTLHSVLGGERSYWKSMVSLRLNHKETESSAKRAHTE